MLAGIDDTSTPGIDESVTSCCLSTDRERTRFGGGPFFRRACSPPRLRSVQALERSRRAACRARSAPAPLCQLSLSITSRGQEDRPHCAVLVDSSAFCAQPGACSLDHFCSSRRASAERRGLLDAVEASLRADDRVKRTTGRSRRKSRRETDMLKVVDGACIVQLTRPRTSSNTKTATRPATSRAPTSHHRDAHAVDEGPNGCDAHARAPGLRKRAWSGDAIDRPGERDRLRLRRPRRSERPLVDACGAAREYCVVAGALLPPPGARRRSRVSRSAVTSAGGSPGPISSRDRRRPAGGGVCKAGTPNPPTPRPLAEAATATRARKEEFAGSSARRIPRTARGPARTRPPPPA